MLELQTSRSSNFRSLRSYNYRTMIVLWPYHDHTKVALRSFLDCSKIVRWLYKDRTMIVLWSYHDRTMIVPRLYQDRSKIVRDIFEFKNPAKYRVRQREDIHRSTSVYMDLVPSRFWFNCIVLILTSYNNRIFVDNDFRRKLTRNPRSEQLPVFWVGPRRIRLLNLGDQIRENELKSATFALWYWCITIKTGFISSVVVTITTTDLRYRSI